MAWLKPEALGWCGKCYITMLPESCMKNEIASIQIKWQIHFKCSFCPLKWNILTRFKMLPERFSRHFLPCAASGSGFIQTLDLGIMRQVFYHCTRSTSLKCWNRFKKLFIIVMSFQSWLQKVIVIKLFTIVIYCHFMEIPPLCVMKLYYLNNYRRMALNYYSNCVTNVIKLYLT